MRHIMCLGLVSLGILLSLTTSIEAMAIQACTDDQYTRVLQNGSIMCVDCFRCPDGLGPSIECGNKVKADTKLDCQMCKAGFTFSSSNDYEQCQTCSICSKDQVSKPCTTTRDTVCEKKCISKWNYYEESSDDCQECSYCCGDEKDIVKNECKVKGMPAHKSCTVHRRKKCTPAPTTTTTVSPTTGYPTTFQSATILTVKTTKYDNNVGELSTRKPTNQSISSKHVPRSSSKSSYTTGQVFIGVSCGLSVLLVGLVVCWCITYYKKCWKHKYSSSSESSQVPMIIYTINEESAKLFEWLNEDHELKDKVCNKLDTQKSFAKIARHYKMDEDRVRKLEENPGDAPTRQVFDFLEGAQPQLLVKDFGAYLEKINRRDVLTCFKEKQGHSPKEIHVPLLSA